MTIATRKVLQKDMPAKLKFHSWQQEIQLGGHRAQSAPEPSDKNNELKSGTDAVAGEF